MEFNAYKMDGLGNDFVIIDQRVKTINLSKENIVKICSRDFIGCDQLIYINKNKDNKDKDDKGNKDQKDKNDPKKDEKKNQNQKPKPQQGKMSPQQVKQLLES